MKINSLVFLIAETALRFSCHKLSLSDRPRQTTSLWIWLLWFKISWKYRYASPCCFIKYRGLNSRQSNGSNPLLNQSRPSFPFNKTPTESFKPRFPVCLESEGRSVIQRALSGRSSCCCQQMSALFYERLVKPSPSVKPEMSRNKWSWIKVEIFLWWGHIAWCSCLLQCEWATKASLKLLRETLHNRCTISPRAVLDVCFKCKELWV